jgi:pimeloyl-ACP methyl ester carboxylesterase
VLTARRSHAPAPEAPTPAFGTLQRLTAQLRCGEVSYLRHGSGPPLLLVHGIPTSARLWEGMLGALGEHFDCIAPDLLGLGHSAPAPGADLASPGQADMLAELLDALGIDTVALVCHDQGGSHGLQLLVRHGARVERVVFMDVVCFDNWLVPAVALLVGITRAPRLLGALGRSRALETSMRLTWPLPQTTHRAPLPAALIDDWFRALRTGGEPLRAWAEYVAVQSNRWTLEAVPALEAWDKPAAVVWAAEDRFLPVSWATRLAETLPTAGPPVLLPFAGHFFQTEIPQTAARVLLDQLGAVRVT